MRAFGDLAQKPSVVKVFSPVRVQRPGKSAFRVKAFKERDPREENVAGSFFVDHTCIDCDTCRWMQPKVFGRVNGMTAVVEQPEGGEETLRSAQALLACPTHSIHIRNQNGEVRQAAKSFPVLVPGTQNVYHCGYHSEHSYGAASYFIKRKSGNIMMDSPRFDKSLLKNLKEMGGVKYMVLSHKDDVCDHARWAEELGLERIIHKTEITRSQGTSACEHQLEGEGPWMLPNEDDAFQIIHTPGHTRGHVVMLYQNEDFPDENACFTGDHLGFSRLGGLTIFKRVNWFSVEEQLKSVDKLQGSNFIHVLPGHGRPGKFECPEDREIQLSTLLKDEDYLPTSA